MDKKRKEPCEDTTESPDQGTSRSVTGRSSLHTPGSSESKRKRVTFESDVLKADLETKYLFLFPEEFFVFWKHVQMLAGRDGNPCEVFGRLKSLRLCGVFDYLAGHLKNADTEKCLLHDRQPTDLPEMQTLAIYSGGRFAYWRDEPNTEKPLLVHVDNAVHFPKCVIVGAVDPFFMIAHLIGGILPAKYRSFFSRDWVEHYNVFTAHVRTITKSRKKETVGLPFHGIGIRVEIVNGVGYRPLREKTGKLKDLITSVVNASSGEQKQKKLEKIMDIVSRVQFGHDIFWANHDFFDKMAGKVLTMAYKLLNREVFARILELHMPLRRSTSD